MRKSKQKKAELRNRMQGKSKSFSSRAGQERVVTTRTIQNDPQSASYSSQYKQYSSRNANSRNCNTSQIQRTATKMHKPYSHLRFMVQENQVWSTQLKIRSALTKDKTQPHRHFFIFCVVLWQNEKTLKRMDGINCV